ncbi:MAG: sugar ABC transporter substrate-binding protein, partial [Arthrobacter sp.]
MRSTRQIRLRAGSMGAAGVALALALTACGGSGDAGNEADGTLKVWAHSGQASEAEALQGLVDQFNDANEDISVELTLVPEADYTSTIQATKAEDLPDIMEMDAPTMASFVYDRKLVPLEGIVSEEVLDNRIGGVKESGTYNGETFAVGMFDVGLG